MKKISEIQSQIKSSLSHCCSSLGFDVDKSPTFYNSQIDVLRILHIGFLDVKNAAYFNSNTASFILNLGIFFNSGESSKPYPKEYEAHVRGTLLRDFYQKNPMELKGFSFFNPERRRRDIWWVEKDGSNLDDLLAHASHVIKRNAFKWLDQYSNIEYVIKYLESKREKSSWQGGPFGFGAIGSPCRQNLIRMLENRNG